MYTDPQQIWCTENAISTFSISIQATFFINPKMLFKLIIRKLIRGAWNPQKYLIKQPIFSKRQFIKLLACVLLNLSYQLLGTKHTTTTTRTYVVQHYAYVCTQIWKRNFSKESVLISLCLKPIIWIPFY